MQKIMQIAAAIDQMIYEMFAISQEIRWAIEHSLLFEQCKPTIYNPLIWTRNTA